MRYIKPALLVVLTVIGLTGCIKNAKPVTTVARYEYETVTKENETKEAVLIKPKINITSNKEAVTVRILDEADRIIEGESFTVCFVAKERELILDKELSATISGAEYIDEDKDGTIKIIDLMNGTYSVYLRPIEGYEVAAPIPISFVTYNFDEAITKKIKQQNEVDASKEDSQYNQSQKTNNKSVKVKNIISGDFILGQGKEFVVDMPLLNEKDEVVYEKVNSKKLERLEEYEKYITDNNRETLLVGGEYLDIYVCEETKYDDRLLDKYVSKGIQLKEDEYILYNLIPYMTTGEEYIYTGWYSRKGKQYYNDEDGYPVTGWQRLEGMWYYFNEDGEKASVIGLDVSEYQKEIDWDVLKASGIDFVIIRCGYRGYVTGVLVEDAMFRRNIEEATRVNMPFGVYIFSQAVNEQEAAEEASMILELCKGYEPTLPYAIDIEACGDKENVGRQNIIDNDTRTAVINTFCRVIRSRQEEPMLYASKSYYNTHMNMGMIDCKLWYAMWPGETVEGQDATEPDVNMVPDREVEVWQFSSMGIVDGIEERVDLNAWIPNLE